MTNNLDDPFELCHECRTLGHCRLRAPQALAKYAQAPARYVKPSPPPEPYAGPVYTLREFVAEHRPELTKLLPRMQDDKPDSSVSSRPTLGQLQKMIAARKTATAPETPAPVMESVPAPVAIQETIKKAPLKKPSHARLRLVQLGAKPGKHQRSMTVQRRIKAYS